MPPRTRTRVGNPVSTPFRDQRVTSTGTLIWDITSPGSHIPHYETMSDMIDLTRVDHPVSHYKATRQLSPINWSGPDSTAQDANIITLSGTTGFGSNSSEPIPSASIDDFAVNFANNIKGVMKEETSLGNFILELNELKRTFSFLSSRLPNKLSGGILAVNFGILPFISDMQAIASSYDSIVKRLRFLKKNSGKPVRVNHRKTVTWTPSNSAPPAAGVGFAVYTKKLECQATISGNAWVVYDVSNIPDSKLASELFKQYFGLNNPAKIVWNAIPYSFVLDWVSNLGDLLNRLVIPPSIPHVVQRCTWSSKVQGVREYYFYANTVGVVPLLKGSERFTYYSRNIGIPCSVPTLELQEPSLKQLMLGLSLLHQKWYG